MDEEIQRLFDEGNRARLSGDYAAAQPLLEDAIRACPDAARCWWALGHVLMNLGEFETAASRFEKAIELEPKNQTFMLDLAKLFEMLGEFDAARPVLERIIEVDGSSKEADGARKSLSYY
jgi:tetratricopeptide (TPR) repeat protein